MMKKEYSIFFLPIILGVIGLIIGVTLGYNFSLKTYDINTSIKNQDQTSSVIQTDTVSKSSWKTFSTEDFILFIPSDWTESAPTLLRSKINPHYYLSFSVNKIRDIKNEKKLTLIEQGKLREYEQLVCEENSTCGTMSQFQNLDIKKGGGLQFVTTFPGISLSEKRGERKEIHQIILKNDTIYRFWTSQANLTNAMEEQYPELKLDPTPLEKFDEIMDSLKID